MGNQTERQRMTIQSRDELESYYTKAGSWAQDRLDSVRASRRTAWIVASTAVIVALAEAFALMFLSPLKTVVPYTLLVDRQTGFVQSLDPIAANKIAPDSALTQSFLVQYVIGRESYDIATVQSDYRKIGLWSAEAARSDYVNSIQVSNPDSPLVRLPRSSTIEARIRSVSPMGKNQALVRFETWRRDRGGAPQPSQGWVALVSYRYTREPMSVEDRFINPLGFQVLRYSKNAETPPVAEIGESRAQRSGAIPLGPNVGGNPEALPNSIPSQSMPSAQPRPASSR
jgi:type IV secretion system protein VirB8